MADKTKGNDDTTITYLQGSTTYGTSNIRTLGGEPTPEELAAINQFTRKEMTAEEVYIFNSLMIDNQETSYFSLLQEPLLAKMRDDALAGVALLLGHDSRKIPVGRTFGSELKSEYDQDSGSEIKSVYGKSYIDLGRKTQDGMMTDDICKGIDAGTTFDVSIGFNASSWKCSICENDIRDYHKCPHSPGREYIIEHEGAASTVETCKVLVGGDGKGELLELSLVFSGACDRATIKNTFSHDSVRENEKSTKLSLVNDFKDIPMDAKIYQYYTKDGSVLVTDTNERSGGNEYLRKRSEQQVELSKLLEIINTGLEANIENEDQLTELITSIKEDKTQLTNKTTELESISAELQSIKDELVTKDSEIETLTVTNSELQSKTEIVEAYRKDLVNETIEMGIRAQGNAFQKDLFEKFLDTLSIEEIKTVREGFDKEVKLKFAGVRTSNPASQLNEKTDYVPSKDEEPEAFSAFIADKAMEYASEHSVSFKEASKIVYEKYKDGSVA
jgi:hypothetical protein